MKVLFQNRKDVFENWGGDSTQMIETKNHLEKIGVHVDINLETNPDVKNYDIIHVFNIQNSEYGLKQILNAKDQQKPVALSTIYWDLSYALNAKETHIYSENNLIRKLAKMNQNIPHLGEKIINFNKKRREYNNIRLMLTKADILLPNSYSELEIISLLFQMPEIRQKSLIVPNAVSISKFKSSSNNLILKNLPKEYILEVGRVGTWKGQLNVIKSLFKHPDISLVFIGNLDSFYAKECMKLGNKRGNTFFLGEIPHEEIYPFYLNAKVHVLPSLRESPGLSSLEASIFGLNCVISIHGPINEYFGFDAYYCDPLNIESIEKSILKAWHSPKNDKLKNRVLKNFNWEKAASQTLTAYNIIKS